MPTSKLTPQMLAAFLLSALALFMSTVDSTIVSTALPSISRALDTSLGWSTLTITAYLAGLTIAMPVAGRLSDSKGRKRMFLAFLAVFTLASLSCALATNIYELVICRFIQALGGGGLMPSVIGLAVDYFGRGRQRAIGLISAAFPMGALAGPVAGGAIVSTWSWRFIFLVNVPLGLVLIAVLALLLAPDPPNKPARVDYLGCLLLAMTLAGIMCGFNLLGDSPPTSRLALALLAASGVSAIGFAVRLSHADHPLLPPKLFTRPDFVVVNSLNVIYGAAAIGIFTLVPLFAQVAYHMGPLQAGTLLSVRAVGMLVASASAALMLQRTGYRIPMLSGFLVVAAGLIFMAMPSQWLNAYAALGVGALAGGIGVGLAGPASNNAAIELLPDDAAAISGLRGMFRQVGGVVSISMLGLFTPQGSTSAAVLRGGFIGLAILMLLAMPAIAWIPEPIRRSAVPVLQPDN